MSLSRLFSFFSRLVRFAALTALACTIPPAAVAQGYPSKVVQLIVPFAAGGPADTLARALGAQLSTALGKGAALAVNDLLAGQVDSGFLVTRGVLPYVTSGKLVPLVVSSSRRSQLLPEVPTVAEAGFPGATLEFSMVLLAPAKTPDAIVRRLHEEARKALTGPDMSQLMASNDFMVVADTPEQAEARLAATTKTRAELISIRSIKAD